jgi:membrane protein
MARAFAHRSPRPRRVAPLLDVAALLTVFLAAWARARAEAARNHDRRGDFRPETRAGQPARDDGRGRRARTPRQIPARGWKDVLWRTWKEFREDEITAVAGSVAYSCIVAVFPGMAAFVSLYGLFAEVDDVRRHLAILAGVIPADVLTLIGQQMVRIASHRHAGLGVTFVFGLLLSLWSANAGVKAMLRGLNIAYDEQETRGFLKLNLVSLGFTVGGVLFAALASAAVVAAPVLLNALSLEADLAPLALLRWPALFLVTLLGLAALYRYGPNRNRPRWRWVTSGSLAATALWLLGSAAFSWYVSEVANYNATYGSLGAVFGFLTWIWLSAVAVLFGAELNAEIERQTAEDSTVGRPAPMGARGADAADTLGRPAPGGLRALFGGGRR